MTEIEQLRLQIAELSRVVEALTSRLQSPIFVVHQHPPMMGVPSPAVSGYPEWAMLRGR